MNRNNALGLIFVTFMASSCSFHDTNSSKFVCENYFVLVNDFDHRFPDQDDYMQYLKFGYYETYYNLISKNNKNYNCHYHLEYKDGQIIDEWGFYTCDGRSFSIYFDTIGFKNPLFCFYHSPTIDFHIIDKLEIGSQQYKIVYQARYLYSAKG